MDKATEEFYRECAELAGVTFEEFMAEEAF